jgi:hypothetical protein
VEPVIIRATIARETPHMLALAGQSAGVPLTAWTSFGAGDWGVEPGATFETAVPWGPEALKVCVLLDRLLRAGRQDCAYVTVADETGTEAWLYYPGGRTEPIGARQ